MGAAMYAASQSEGGDPQAGAFTGDFGEGSPQDDDVVEAEIVDDEGDQR